MKDSLRRAMQTAPSSGLTKLSTVYVISPPPTTLDLWQQWFFLLFIRVFPPHTFFSFFFVSAWYKYVMLGRK